MGVSVLFNEPKLLKFYPLQSDAAPTARFSALQRAEIAEIEIAKALDEIEATVSVLFNEPKLLKCSVFSVSSPKSRGFSALQRAEIAEMANGTGKTQWLAGFSALQRAEIAEIGTVCV